MPDTISPADALLHPEYVVVEVVELFDHSQTSNLSTLNGSEPIEIVEVFMVEPDPGATDPAVTFQNPALDPTHDPAQDPSGAAAPGPTADASPSVDPLGDPGLHTDPAATVAPTATADHSVNTDPLGDPGAPADTATPGIDASVPSTPDAAAAPDTADTGDQTAHASAAQAAQQEADSDVASGDYAAASQARENAETESAAAGDDTMLHGSSSSDLSTADTAQSNASYDEQQEAQAAASGDYATAKEDAQHAAGDTRDADYNAGGSDHSGQASAEADKEDWAVWHQENADQQSSNADWYAAQGDADHAATASDASASEASTAATDGAEGQYGSAMETHDSSSDVATDTPVEDHTPTEEAPAPDTSADDASG